MRAWQVTGSGEPESVLKLAEVDPPKLVPGTVHVRVRAAGVGLPDALLCRGSYALTPELPFTPGQELVGEVISVGEGAAARVGQRVMAVSGFHLRHGSFAQECLAVGDFALRVPDEMSDTEAAGFAIPFHTAWVGLVRRGSLKPGETLLVLGAGGGTGSAALQLGKALGARVLAVAGNPARIELCERLGADAVIDYKSTDLVDAVRSATGGRGADVVFDTVGGDAFRAATRVVAHEGRILVVGFASGRWGEPSMAHLVARGYSLLGVMPGGYDLAVRLSAHEDLLALWRTGALRVPVHRVYDFEDVPAAVAAVGTGSVAGKVIVRVGEGEGDGS